MRWLVLYEVVVVYVVVNVMVVYAVMNVVVYVVINVRVSPLHTCKTSIIPGSVQRH